jgi:hypothetical protein
MDYVAGRNVSSISPVAQVDIDGTALADELFHAFLDQILVHGFVHADPHPGNVLLTDDGRLALIDLGMVTRVDEATQDKLLRLLVAVSDGRGREAADVLIALADPVEKKLVQVKDSVLPRFREVAQYWKTVLRSGVIGVLTGLIVLFYPQEPIAKGDASSQMAEFWDIMRFYYHHWMIMAVPLLLVLWKRHTLSYKRIWVAPVGLLLLMLFIILNQIFQSDLGFIPLRDAGSAVPNYKNTSYIWGPLNGDGSMDPIGGIFNIFCPSWFKTLPVSCEGYSLAEGAVKYWPWFWMIFPVVIIVTPLAFGLCMIFDGKRFGRDVAWFKKHLKSGGLREDFKRLGRRIHKAVTEENPKKVKAKQ